MEKLGRKSAEIPDRAAVAQWLMAAHVLLPWGHRVFANLKRWGTGVLHGFRKAHLDRYLQEFVFRWNRRRHTRVAFESLPRHRGRPTARLLPGLRGSARLNVEWSARAFRDHGVRRLRTDPDTTTQMAT
jgi:hypothetical protein